MRKILLLTAIAAASGAQAGGFENARLDTAFMYEEGNLVSISPVRKSFSVKGNISGTNKSLVGDSSSVSLSAKYDVSDKIAVGLTRYNSGAIHVDYQGAGGVLTANGPKANLSSDSTVLIAGYRLSDNLVLSGGVRYDQFSIKDADLFKVLGDSAAAPSVSSASDVAPIFAIAYLKPEIALRVELVHQAKSSVSMATVCGSGATLCANGNSTGGIAQLTTLNLQTGIAKDTLAFGTIHMGRWSKSQLSVSDIEAGPLAGPTSAFEDSTEYSLGLGRRFNENLSGSISYNWESSGDGKTSSLFTLNDGYQGISIGGKYSTDDIEISVGYNYTKLGDVKYESSVSSLTNSLRDNHVSALGARFTAKF